MVVAAVRESVGSLCRFRRVDGGRGWSWVWGVETTVTVRLNLLIPATDCRRVVEFIVIDAASCGLLLLLTLLNVQLLLHLLVLLVQQQQQQLLLLPLLLLLLLLLLLVFVLLVQQQQQQLLLLLLLLLLVFVLLVQQQQQQLLLLLLLLLLLVFVLLVQQQQQQQLQQLLLLLLLVFVLLVLNVLVVQHVVVTAQFDLLVEQIQSVTQHVIPRFNVVHRHQPTIVQTYAFIQTTVHDGSQCHRVQYCRY